MVEVISTPTFHRAQPRIKVSAEELLSRLGGVKRVGIAVTPEQLASPHENSFLSLLKLSAEELQVELVPVKSAEIQAEKDRAKSAFVGAFGKRAIPKYKAKLSLLLALTRKQKLFMQAKIREEQLSHVFVDSSQSNFSV